MSKMAPLPIGRRWSVRFCLVSVILVSLLNSITLTWKVFSQSERADDAETWSSVSYLSPVEKLQASSLLGLGTTTAQKNYTKATKDPMNGTTTASTLAALPTTIVFLGILSNHDWQDFTERQRRHLIRNTWLASPPSLPKVCSLSEYLHSTSSSVTSPCRLVYTFVATTSTSPLFDDASQQTPQAFLSSSTSSMANLTTHESDILFFSQPPTTNNTKTITNHGARLRWEWLKYLNSQISIPHIASSADRPWTYFAYTDTYVILKPHVFWKHPLLLPPAAAWEQPHVYAGLPMNRTTCIHDNKKCPTLQHEAFMRRFVLLSSSLVQDMLLVHQQQELPPGSSPDVSIANAVPKVGVDWISLRGTVMTTTPKHGGTIGEYLQLYDKYKDSLVNYTQYYYHQLNEDDHDGGTLVSQSSPSSPPRRDPRIFLGIFSTSDNLEAQRRQMIRRTYLQRTFATDGDDGGSDPPRICSVSEFQRSLDREMNNNVVAESSSCQLVYAFVVGANPEGPTEGIPKGAAGASQDFSTLLTNETLPLERRLPDHDKGDIMYLNIRENGKEGKSQTFFYAALSLYHDDASASSFFDYIAKVDSDTLLFPDILLNQVLPRLPHLPHSARTYVGEYRIKPSTSSLNLGPAYMGGHFYMLSPDLARYITSVHCNRSALGVYSEDQSIGNFVHSLGEPIRRLWIREKVLLHPIKRVDRLRTLWNKYVEDTKKKL